MNLVRRVPESRVPESRVPEFCVPEFEVIGRWWVNLMGATEGELAESRFGTS